jgi:two-component system, chemotaxis family, CheB/CheR fusion protein
LDAFVPHRVLVVDDNRDIANSVAALLRLLGHTVLPAYDGATAVALAASFKPEIAIIDLMMPGMDGFELARQLHANVDIRPLKIVALTAQDQPATLDRARDAGIPVHLIKPTSAQELMNVLAF